MSKDASDDKPTEYLPGGAMANAYVPRGRQTNRRITRQVAQPDVDSGAQRKIPVPNPPAGAPSAVGDAAALSANAQTEGIPAANVSAPGSTGYVPAHAAGTRVLDGSGNSYPDSGAATTQLPPIDPAAATPEVDSYPQGVPVSYDPKVDAEKLREEQEYEEERADKRRLLKVVGIVTAIVALLTGAVVVVALMISSRQVLPPAEQETTTSQRATTSSSTPETTRSQPQTQEPTSSEPSQTQTTSREPTPTKTTGTTRPTAENPTPPAEQPTGSQQPSEQPSERPDPSESNSQ